MTDLKKLLEEFGDTLDGTDMDGWNDYAKRFLEWYESRQEKPKIVRSRPKGNHEESV